MANKKINVKTIHIIENQLEQEGSIIEWFDPEETQIIYQGYVYSPAETNVDTTVS